MNAPFAHRIRRLKTLPVLPTLLTAGNLACGITAILCAAHNYLFEGAVLIFVAMICDMFDGKVARMTKQDGPFGAELDSLSDVVSFGVAPAILVHRLILGEPGVFDPGQRILWFVTVFYPVMAAIRLARYNVEHSGPAPADASPYFRGIPSPGAAAVIAALVIVHQYNHEFLGSPKQMVGYTTLLASLDWFRWVLLAVTLVCALVMVSTVRYPHAGNTLFGRMSYRKFIPLLTLGALFVWKPDWMLAIITTGYLAYGLIVSGVRSLLDWRAGRSVMDDDEEEAAEDAGLPGSVAPHEGPAPGR